MAKSVADAVLDAALDEIATSNQQHVCSAEPTTRTEAVTTFNLASVSMAGGDFTNANGDTSGRKCTVGAKAGVSVSSTGTATHVALTTASSLHYVTTCTSQWLTSGNSVNIPAWDIEIRDPT